MRHLAVIFGLVGMMVLAGCNTIRGAGEDVEAGGEAISDAATEVQSEM